MITGERQEMGGANTRGRSLLQGKARLLLIVIVLVLGLGYLVYMAFPANALYYLTVGEFQGREPELLGKPVRVVGKLVPDSFHRETGSTEASFILSDGTNKLQATYIGVVPELFFSPLSDIVLEGTSGPSGVFSVREVIVKCPSKYQAISKEDT